MEMQEVSQAQVQPTPCLGVKRMAQEPRAGLLYVYPEIRPRASREVIELVGCVLAHTLTFLDARVKN